MYYFLCYMMMMEISILFIVLAILFASKNTIICGSFFVYTSNIQCNMAYAISIELIIVLVFIVFKIQVKYTIYKEKYACLKSGQC